MLAACHGHIGADLAAGLVGDVFGSWSRFNALLPLALRALAFRDDPQRVALPLMVMFGYGGSAGGGHGVLAAVVAGADISAWLGDYFLLCWPRVYPWYALWPLVASIFGRGAQWNRAAWVLSGTVLAAYGVHYAGTVRTGQVPLWLLVLEWAPVAVVEGQQLVRDVCGPRAVDGGPVAAALAKNVMRRPSMS